MRKPIDGDRIYSPNGAVGRLISYEASKDEIVYTIRWDDGITTDHLAGELAGWRRESPDPDHSCDLVVETTESRLARWEVAAEESGVTLDYWVGACLDSASGLILTGHRPPSPSEIDSLEKECRAYLDLGIGADPRAAILIRLTLQLLGRNLD